LVGTLAVVALTNIAPPAAAQEEVYVPHHGSSSNQLLSIESAAASLDNADSLAKRLRRYPDPGLRIVASPVQTTLGSSELEKVVDLLSEAMVGNATTAVQYGIDARIVVLRGDSSPSVDNDNGNNKPFFLINPIVMARSSEDKMVLWREYCGVVTTTMAGEEEASTATNSNSLQQPRPLEVDLLRDAVVEVAAQDVTGKPIRKALSGEVARAFQHELDHLNGILVVDHADLTELPADIAGREAPFHRARQQQAFARTIYSGNGPLYW